MKVRYWQLTVARNELYYSTYEITHTHTQAQMIPVEPSTQHKRQFVYSHHPHITVFVTDKYNKFTLGLRRCEKQAH